MRLRNNRFPNIPYVEFNVVSKVVCIDPNGRLRPFHELAEPGHKVWSDEVRVVSREAHLSGLEPRLLKGYNVLHLIGGAWT